MDSSIEFGLVNVFLSKCGGSIQQLLFLFLFPDSPSPENSDSKVAFCDATKQILIQTPPQVLTLHLKRFSHQGRKLKKNNRHIAFPAQLDLRPFCTQHCQVRAGGGCKGMGGGGKGKRGREERGEGREERGEERGGREREREMGGKGREERGEGDGREGKRREGGERGGKGRQERGVACRGKDVMRRGASDVHLDLALCLFSVRICVTGVVV